MKAKRIGLGVAVLAALTVATGGTAVAQPHDDGFGGQDRSAGHDIIVKGNHNQIVLGNDNHVARGDIENETETDENEDENGNGNGNGNGNEATTPAPPYATVNSLVTSYLSERQEPTTRSTEVARHPRGAHVPIACYVPDGEPVDGNRTWYLVRDDPGFVAGFISAHFATLTGSVSRC